MNEPAVTFSDSEQDLLKRSFALVGAKPRQASEIFYASLFQLAPDTRDLFVNDMNRQGEKLIATLSSVVLQIGNMERLRPAIEELGLRHVAYGVLPEYYSATGTALFQMLEQLLQDDFSPDVRAVWEKAYNVIADIMVTAVENRKSAPRLSDDI